MKAEETKREMLAKKNNNPLRTGTKEYLRAKE